jgi:hypothetical protein
MADNTGDDGRPLWQLSRDEQRVLLITFVGGLASIMVGAALVGVAFVLAHYEQKIHPQNWFTFGLTTGILVAMTVLLFVAHWTIPRPDRGAVYRRALALVDTLVALSWCICILWLVGVVAGIH